MRILIYGADLPDDLTPEDIGDDHIPYGFLSAERVCGKVVVGIAIAQQGDEDDEEEILDVPHMDALDEFQDADDAVLVPLAQASAPVQYAQARAAWGALQGLYTSLPDAALFVLSLPGVDVLGLSDLDADSGAEFH